MFVLHFIQDKGGNSCKGDETQVFDGGCQQNFSHHKILKAKNHVFFAIQN